MQFLLLLLCCSICFDFHFAVDLNFLFFFNNICNLETFGIQRSGHDGNIVALCDFSFVILPAIHRFDKLFYVFFFFFENLLTISHIFLFILLYFLKNEALAAEAALHSTLDLNKNQAVFILLSCNFRYPASAD